MLSALSGITALRFRHLLNVFLFLIGPFFALTDQNAEDMDGYIGFLAALRCSYYKFVKDLSKQCKQIVRHHLDSVTSPYSHICYENDSLSGIGSVANSMNRFNHFIGSIRQWISTRGSSGEHASKRSAAYDATY